MQGCEAASDGAGIFVFQGNLQSNATAAWPEHLLRTSSIVPCSEEVATSEDMLFENCSSGAYGGVHAFAFLIPWPWKSWSPALKVRVT